MMRCCSLRGVVRYPWLYLLFILGCLVSFYYFVSNGGTYDPISGLGKPDHHIRLKSSQHKRFVTNDLDSNDKKNLLYGLHHARHLDDNHQGGHHTNKAADESHDEEDQNEKTKTKESEEGEEIQRAKARIRKHCNPPDHKVSGAEGEVPEGYTLEMVHILIRHGDRSPMNGIPSYPNSKINCQLHPARFPHPRLHDFSNKMSQVTLDGASSSAAKRLGLFPNHKYCEGAQLTGTGTIQQILNGEFLQQVYMSQWGLFSPHGYDVLVKSTDYSRTYQSAVALLFGLLPKLDMSKMKIHVVPNTQLCSTQFLNSPMCKCMAAKKLQKVVQSEYAKRTHNNSLHAAIRGEVATLLNVRSSRLPWIAAIVDVVLGDVCHKEELPCFPQTGKCLNWPLIGKMWQFLDYNGREQNENSLANIKLQRLLMHPLMVEISQRLANVTRGIAPRRFVLYSGHDTTVMPLAVALGIHDGIWPPYATRLVIELYSKHSVASNKRKYYVRVLFNGQDRTRLLRFCHDYLNTEHMCPLQRFQDFVNIENIQFFNAKSYADACTR